MWRIPQETTDLVTFAKEILNRKLIFFVQCEQSGRHQPRDVFRTLVIVYNETFSQKFFIIHRLPQIACPMPIRFAKNSETWLFFGRAHLILQNKKLYLQISSQIGKTMKKLQCILNTICVHQLTCNILIMFTYLTASNPIYLLVHCQTFMHCLFILYLKLTWI